MGKTKQTDSELIVQRVFKTDPQTIFKALTQEDKLRQWFHPRPDGWSVEVAFNPIAGETYQLIMVDPEGKRYEHKGEIREVKLNKKLVFTWSSHVVKDTLVTIMLNKVTGGTRITLTHDFLPAGEKDGHREGWTELFGQLSDLINQKTEVK